MAVDLPVPLPASTFGVWRRRREESPPGHLSDDATVVYWLQSPCGLHVDVRVPVVARTPEPPATAVAVVQLAEHKGFAGTTTAWTTPDGTGTVLTWARSIDFRPPTGVDDAGEIEVSADGKELKETGWPAKDYVECWERVTDGTVVTAAAALPPHFCSLTLDAADDDEGRTGVWVVAGRQFGLALSRPTSGPGAAVTAAVTKPASSLVAAFETQALSDDDRQAAVTSCEVVYGTVGNPRHYSGVIPVQWRVDHATNPVLEGRAYFPPASLRPTAGGHDLEPGSVVVQDVPGGGKRKWVVQHASPGFDARCFQVNDV